MSAGLLVTLPALGETANERTMAEALFRQGRELMSEGNFAAACPKFAESHRLDPGAGTLLNLAVCHEKQGKLASAWAEFQEALALARADGRDDRIALAEQRIAALEPQLARLTITVPPSAPEDMVLVVNGTPVGAAAWGAPMPLDAGSVRVEASASGRQKFVESVEIRDGESYVVEVPELSSASDTGPAGESPGDTTADNESNHAAAYVVGGLGIAAIGVGSYFGVRALQDHKIAEDGCEDECSTKTASQAEQNAVFHGWVSTVGIAAGLAAVGVAIYLYADAEAEPAEASQVALVPSAGAQAVGLDLIWVY